MTNIHSLPQLQYISHLKSPEDVNSLSMDTLMSLKQEIDNDLHVLFGHLSKFNATLETDLLTIDGFPRQDIDVAAIRLTRSHIRALQNDYKWIMDRIHLLLTTM